MILFNLYELTMIFNVLLNGRLIGLIWKLVSVSKKVGFMKLFNSLV